MRKPEQIESAGLAGKGQRAPSPCLLCGKCCQALSLEQTKSSLRILARQEQLRLERNPGHRHRQEMMRLIRDVGFILRHFRRLSRQKALSINPLLAGEAFRGRYFYTCKQLDPKGACLSHELRPYVCEGYPWYYGSPDRGALFVLPCGYERELEA